MTKKRKTLTVPGVSVETSTTSAPASPDKIVKVLNRCYEDLVWIDEKESTETRAKPHVCTVCDVFLKTHELDGLELEKFQQLKSPLITTFTKRLDEDIRKCYVFDVPSEYRTTVNDVLLSPRGRCYVLPSQATSPTKKQKRDACMMSICKRCKRSLQRGRMPRFAISNGYFFGTPPSCLLELTDIERAWITPVKAFGIVYVFTGGPRQELKGTASFYKRSAASIATANAKLDVLGLTKEGVSVVLLGSMTREQIAKAKRKAKIRPEKIKMAIDWLIKHNQDWKSIDLARINSALDSPMIIQDESNPVDSAENNVEDTETFRVYFPDGTLQSNLGGQQTSSHFLSATLNERAVNTGIGLNGPTSRSTMFLQEKYHNERVQDYKDRNLMNACLLQFPYGRGGLGSETRCEGKDSRPRKVTHEEYIEHLSKISQQHFHHQLFTLIIYNYLMKDWMVRKAAVACRNRRTAEQLAENLTSEQFLKALEQRRKKERITSDSAQKMLSTLEAFAACAPHTNEAAKKARYKIETMQCHFGLPSWFLTVTPDDENSLLLQVYSRENVSLGLTSWDQIESMSDDELSELGVKKRTLRCKYPGIAALNFESQRDAIIEHVIGWDTKEDCPTSTPGLFGICRAFVVTVEEQGRKSLHMHILIWIALTQKAFTSIFNPNMKGKRDAEEFLCDELDRVSSCELIGKTPRDKRKKLFHHEKCETFNSMRYPRQPVLISNQRLRDLRNSEGYKVKREHLKCDYCSKTFFAHELIQDYLKDLGMEKLSSFPENKSKRIKAMAMALINAGGTDPRTKPVFDAAYNHHIHTKTSCFRNDYCDSLSIDYRYKYPRLSQDIPLTRLLHSGYITNWYHVDGSYTPRSILEPTPRRNVTDVFMNQYCIGVGQTKLINGNTNVSLLTPGPVVMYTTKYAGKGTQKQDGKEFEYISDRVQKAANKLDIENLERKRREQNGTIQQEEREDLNRRDALTRVLRLGFSCHQPNIVGAPLASYLIRNKTRFLFSHEFKFAPIWDINTLLEGGKIKLFLQRKGSETYCDNRAYDYICRPTECEEICLFQFMKEFEIVSRRPSKDNGIMSFIQTNDFVHPSKRSGNDDKSGSYRAGIRKKDMTSGHDETLIQIPSYFLPDTASFGNSIKEVLSANTEEYCKKVLMLFKPFRTLTDLRTLGPKTKAYIANSFEQLGSIPMGTSKSEFLNDIKENGSYTETFWQWIDDKRHSKTKQDAIQFLQNFQDCSYNCTRTKSRNGDELDRLTHKYRNESMEDATYDHVSHSSEEDNDEDDDVHFMDEAEVENLVKLLCPEQYLSANMTKKMPQLHMSRLIRDKGRFKCGYEDLALMKPKVCSHEDSTSTESIPWLEIGAFDEPAGNLSQDGNDNGTDTTEAPSKEEILQIIVEQKNRVVRKEEMFPKNADVYEPNGSADSIISWSHKAKLDETQRLAFEMIVASFVLTFYENNDNHGSDNETEDMNLHDLQQYQNEKAKLEKLVDIENRGSRQLIALLYGAGGAGKSYVIDLVMLYSREYCGKFSNFLFDKRTIAVTAVTGCAATLLNGETVHGAMDLNTKLKNIDKETTDAWKRTRLIIIDEISFASKETMDALNDRLKQYRDLEDSDPTLFGGIHMVIAGDFRQLDPVGQPPLYETAYSLETKVNCFLELTGTHRFRNDPEWGRLLKRFRDGTVTRADIDKLNEHIRKNKERLPDNLKYATFRNSDRDAINAALFDKTVFQRSEQEAEMFGLLVFADEIHLKTGKKRYNKRLGCCDLLYRDKSESDILFGTNSSQRMDPVLKLYRGIRVLLTKNKDVPNGIANGTQAEVVRIVLKNGETYGTTRTDDGYGNSLTVKAVLATQIDYVELRHLNDRVAIPLFRLKPEEYFFKTKLDCGLGKEQEIGMKATQLPIVVNNATTGHKMQGSTVNSIFIHQWSKKRNWNYVVMSRVREMKGLFARSPLPSDLELYKVPQKLTDMLDILRLHKVPSSQSERYQLCNVQMVLNEKISM